MLITKRGSTLTWVLTEIDFKMGKMPTVKSSPNRANWQNNSTFKSLKTELVLKLLIWLQRSFGLKNA